MYPTKREACKLFSDYHTQTHTQINVIKIIKSSQAQWCMPINHCAWEAQTEQVSGYSGLPRDFQAIVRPCLTQIKKQQSKNQELGMVVYSFL